MPTNDRVTLWRFLDHAHRLINRIEELPGSSRGSLEIPFERSNNFGPRDLANSEPVHLLELLPEIVPDVWPDIARLGCRIRLCLAEIKLGGHIRRDRRSKSRIEAIPQSPHELNTLFSG
jgi:hypothetical protein